MSIRVEPFNIAHINIAELAGEDIREFKRHAKDLISFPAGTFIYDGRIVGFAGVVICKENDIKYGHVWLVPTEYIKTGYKSLIKELRLYMERVAATFDLEYFMTKGHEVEYVQRWLKWMGFEFDEQKGEEKLYRKDIK